jgi:hypothetical protein
MVLGLGALLTLSCSRPAGETKIAAETDAPPVEETPDAPGPLVSVPGVFSYQAPWGWKQVVSSNGYPQAAGPQAHQYVPDITFTTHGFQSVDQFVKNYAPSLLDMDTAFPLRLVDQKVFETDKGVRGVRLHSIDVATLPAAEQFSYVFQNTSGLVVEFACACAPADAAQDAPLFDSAMKTMIFLNPGT